MTLPDETEEPRTTPGPGYVPTEGRLIATAAPTPSACFVDFLLEALG